MTPLCRFCTGCVLPSRLRQKDCSAFSADYGRRRSVDPAVAGDQVRNWRIPVGARSRSAVPFRRIFRSFSRSKTPISAAVGPIRTDREPRASADRGVCRRGRRSANQSANVIRPSVTCMLPRRHYSGVSLWRKASVSSRRRRSASSAADVSLRKDGIGLYLRSAATRAESPHLRHDEDRDS